ncbi:MAG: dienelactone hydrolase family protein [Bacteroidota bacterium]
MRLSLLLLFALALGCNNEEKPAEDIVEVAGDSTFQEKHEKPEAIAYEGNGEMISFETPDGKTGEAYALQSESPSNQYLFVFHEWWGLNDQIKQEADRLFAELDNVHVLAIDLYDGEVTDKREKAAKLTGSRDEERLKAIVKGAQNMAGEQAEIATVGWCFGGGWSTRAAYLLGEQAAGTVVYYGAAPLKQLKSMTPIQTDILGIFAEQDKHITLEYANSLKEVVEAAGQDMTIHTFDADHAFANPSSPRYAEKAAQEANALALDFLKERFSSVVQ